MSDRSDEVEVSESRDTEDLLSETEDLLSGTGLEGESGNSPARTGTDAGARDDTAVGDSSAADDAWWSSDEQATDPAPASQGDAGAESSSSGSRLSGLSSKLSAKNYFSPRTFFVFLLLVGTGLLVGGTMLPIAGQMAGMFGIAFAVGLLSSKRSYLEMGAAGTAVGAISAVADYTMLAVAGSYQTVLAVGVAVGLVACLLGYYFGRDLRNGLAQDVE
ncbi:hypothetical protein [Natronolimnohabitans innermongolicus]|nr:hypothetical protein [Natronolimnohabitans innermongolicus]